MDKNSVTFKRPQPNFLTSAAYQKEFPEPENEEYAVLGRSNVGKSSFISHVLEHQGLARVSRKPGKTSLANFYRVDPTMIWVDLPGYGYARTSGSERIRWSKLIRNYCEKRENLCGIIWLIDIRHPGVRADREAREWFEQLGIPLFPLLTKGDKLSRSKGMIQAREAVTVLRLPEEPVVYSTMQHSSRDRFWMRFIKWREKVAGD